MPKVFFVKDGRGDHHTSQAHNAKIEDIERMVTGVELRYFSNGPTINGDIIASPFSPFRYVVVEFGDEEFTTRFSCAGFYLAIGLDPIQAQESLNISNVQ